MPVFKNVPAVRRRYRLLGSVFEIGFADETLCRAVDPALRHLATTERPDVTGAVIADAGGFSCLIEGGEVGSVGERGQVGLRVVV